ncbi:hypothetical protein PROFUN_02831 [Planoprotostelium fungivorum]|uniref:mRNA cap guanine-N(7) methyltransferase n=1 Tax=Planoprotostelium fungivorum TaxID=1890364 RepID=A0A2P6NHN5_9EUKA|nr:hypothetical protein PROFUN_09224 [Planoprotostelium fungivorum]PRP88735.1 hypothetical protein PROFUN_02831 [Planoprotostelium fungivorum]
MHSSSRGDSYSGSSHNNQQHGDDRRQRQHDRPQHGPSNSNSAVTQIARHYNDRPDLGVAHRQQSKILCLKNFNNWIKSVLISVHCPDRANILDLCGGKGGDLNKLMLKKPQNYVLADVAHQSVKDAVDRFNSKRYNNPSAFIAADCFKKNLLEDLPDNLKFDFVSCQFALHYSFESEERVDSLLYNASCRLNPGRYFVCTIPNAYWIVKRLREADGESFGNPLYRFDFRDKEKLTRFGCTYNFSLVESVDSCPEFLVHIPTLADIGRRYGLELIKCTGSHDYFSENCQAFETLLQRMNVFNDRGTISKEEWEAAGVYMVVIFRKNGEKREPKRESPNPLGNGGRRVSHADIMVK